MTRLTLCFGSRELVQRKCAWELQYLFLNMDSELVKRGILTELLHFFHQLPTCPQTMLTPWPLMLLWKRNGLQSSVPMEKNFSSSVQANSSPDSQILPAALMWFYPSNLKITPSALYIMLLEQVDAGSSVGDTPERTHWRHSHSVSG